MAMSEASDQALWYWCIAGPIVKVEKFGELQDKVDVGIMVRREQNWFIGI